LNAILSGVEKLQQNSYRLALEDLAAASMPRSQLLAAPRRFRLKRSNGWDGTRPSPAWLPGSNKCTSSKAQNLRAGGALAPLVRGYSRPWERRTVAVLPGSKKQNDRSDSGS
jgi:hypothetical protein